MEFTKNDTQNCVNELRKLQIDYIEMKVFLSELGNILDNSFDAESGNFNATKLTSLAETMSKQIDGYYRTSFELANTNSMLNKVSEILKNTKVNSDN